MQNVTVQAMVQIRYSGRCEVNTLQRITKKIINAKQWGETKREGEGETAQQNQSTVETTIASSTALEAMRVPFYSREPDT
jgi:hypothetical protein